MASITNIKVNPQNSKIFVSCLDKTIKIIGLKSGQILRELSGCHESYIKSFDFVRVRSGDSDLMTDDMIIYCGYDGQTVFW